jgi:hypothetical protein
MGRMTEKDETNGVATKTVTIPATGEKVRVTAPSDATLKQVQDNLVRQGKYTPEDFVPPGGSKNSWWIDNLDIPFGIVGAIGGGAGGAMVGGPPGAYAGAAVGGASMTMVGEILEDYLTDEEKVDWADVRKQGGISLMLDLALPGVAKVGKGLYKGGSAGAEWLVNTIKTNRAAGIDPTETRRVLDGQVDINAPGSVESLQTTQNILAEGGATLSPFQVTGKASLKERIANAGLLSQAVGDRNYKRVNEVIQENLKRMLANLPEDVTVGQTIADSIQAGRQVAAEVYQQGFDDLMAEFGTQVVNTRGLNQNVARFMTQGNTAWGSTYSTQTRQIVDEVFGAIAELPQMKATDLIKLEKTLMRRIDEVGTFGSPSYNPTASSELAELSSRIRSSVSNELGRHNPALAKQYNAIKQGYSEAIDGLLPDINRTLIMSANKGDFAAIGRQLGRTGNYDRTKALLASSRKAYELAAKEGVDIPAGSYADIIGAVRRGYIEEILPKAELPSFDFGEYAAVAERMQRTGNQERMKLILGPELAPKFNQLLNVMSEASKSPDGNLGSLAFRSQEFSAVRGAGAAVSPGQLGQAGVMASGNIATALAMLGLPVILAKMTYNPKNINRLLAFDKAPFKDRQTMETAFGNMVADIIRDMPDEERMETQQTLLRLQAVERERLMKEEAK